MKSNCALQTINVKQIVVVVESAAPGRDLLNSEIEPGTTVADVLAHHNLRGYMLLPTGSTIHLAGEEVLWPHVEDGAKLIAVLNAWVGFESDSTDAA